MFSDEQNQIEQNNRYPDSSNPYINRSNINSQYVSRQYTNDSQVNSQYSNGSQTGNQYTSHYYANSGQTSQNQGTVKNSNKPKKSGFKKIVLVMTSGLLFGLCAGLTILLMLQLMPKEQMPASSHEPAEIAKTQQVSPSVSEPAGEAYTQAGGIDATQTAESKEDTKRIAVVTDVTNVVDAVMPSVVSIFGTYAVTESFFGYHFSQEEEGSGSGIIVGQNDDELLIVTNNHVVADSTSLSVQFIDDTTASALVKGTNADEDLAVICVQLKDLSGATKQAIKIATLGDSDKLKVGEPAIAIGNALGYGQSVTTGVISAVNREQSQDEFGRKTYVIQTDAAINPGNSGGALLNVYGEVIGINSSKLAGSTIEGMGYAIPVSTAKPIIEELMSKKTKIPVSESKKGFLGISGINVTESVHEAYGLPMGVYLAQVFDDTPAQKYGLKKGDIIISYDGEEIETMEELSDYLDYSEAGTKVTIGVMEVINNPITGEDEYVEKTIEVVLGQRE